MAMPAVDGAGQHVGCGWDDVVVAVPVIGVGGVCVGEVLVEGALGDEGHHLHAEADAEDRGIGARGLQGAEEEGFVVLAGLVDADGCGVCGVAEGFGDGVVAAGKDEGVAESKVGLDVVGDGREDDGDAAGVCDGLGVGGGDGVAPAVIEHLNIGGDADDWMWAGVCDAMAPGRWTR